MHLYIELMSLILGVDHFLILGTCMSNVSHLLYTEISSLLTFSLMKIYPCVYLTVVWLH
jgi:hypothetical protein